MVLAHIFFRTIGAQRLMWLISPGRFYLNGHFLVHMLDWVDVRAPVSESHLERMEAEPAGKRASHWATRGCVCESETS